MVPAGDGGSGAERGGGVERLEPGAGRWGRCLVATLSTWEILAARKVVLATGQDGTGRWWIPDFAEALPGAFRAHTRHISLLRYRNLTKRVDSAVRIKSPETQSHAFHPLNSERCHRPEPMDV